MSRGTPETLGRTMVTYMVLVIGLITLAPFQFDMPARFEITLAGNQFDIVTNAVLFAVPGFLYRLSTGSDRDRWCIAALLWGVVLSGAVEITQLFIVGRYTSPIDVATNAGGAWMGALFLDAVRRNLNPRLAGRIALELPLMSLFYLLVPLLWLHGYSSGDDLTRVTLAFLPGLLGGTLLAAVWTHRLKPAGVLGPNSIAFIAGAWFLVASITGMKDHPGRVVICAAGVAIITRLQLASPRFHSSADRRFEMPTLKRIAPLLVAYLVLIDLWPWEGQVAPTGFHGGFWYPDLTEQLGPPRLEAMLRELHYLAAVTIGGYVVAEAHGRRDDDRFLVSVLAWTAGAAIVLEVARGLHPAYGASVIRGAFTLGAALLGGVIYHQQVGAVRRILSAHRSGVLD